MKNFKVSVIKWTKKFDIIRKRESENILKEELHKEGFSIVNVIEVWEITEKSWSKFYFDINQNWQIKQWTIFSDDIFKAYLKIKDELKFDLLYIYQNKNDSLEIKEKNIKTLSEQYKVYLETHKKELELEQKEQEKKQKVVKEELTEKYWLQKELQKAYVLLDKVLVKLKYFIEIQENDIITFSRKEKIKDIYNNIVRLKTSTNVSKLYQISEFALSKIWELELEILENKKDEEYRKLVKETNKLLKESWSKTQFIEKEKDIWYILKKIFEDLKNKLKQEKKEKIVIDTKSSSYLKSKILYDKYKEKLKEIEKESLKNLFKIFIQKKENKELLEDLSIKKQIIKNNLFILKSRMNWSTFSYVKVVKWYSYISDLILDLILILHKYFINIFLLYSIFISLVFILNNVFNFNINLNISFLIWIISINLAVFFVYLSRWMITMIINFFILSFIFWIFFINF